MTKMRICFSSQKTISDFIVSESFQMRVLKFLLGVLTSTFCFEDDNLQNNSNSTLTIDPGSSFIVLTTTIPTNIPFVMDFKENFEEKPSFRFGPRTEVSWSCAATMNDNFYIFGGLNEKRQVWAKFKGSILNVMFT